MTIPSQPTSPGHRPNKRPTVVKIGAGGDGNAPPKEKWFYPGRWLVQGLFFAVAAVTVTKIFNAITSSSDDDDDLDHPQPAPSSDAA